MRVFTIPTHPDALDDLRRHCAALGLPAPDCWRHVHLHRTLRELVTADEPWPLPADFGLDARIIGLADPAVFFCNVPPATVQAMAMAYKQEGTWPIFAVITRSALEMSLAVLLEHLLNDRTTEGRARARHATAKAPSPS